MISHISIRDFALIKDISIDLNPGLNIITGETGAGKSILIQAISLALGSRADTTFVRTGCQKATIQISATHNGEEYILTREVSLQGKNLCKVNGNLVTLNELSSISKDIADIHGQYDHQSLLNPESHIKFVDSYAGQEVEALKKEIAEAHSLYINTRSKIRGLLARQSDAQRKKDFMAFELKEIKKAKLKVGEDQELNAKITLFQNSEKLYKDLSEAYFFTYEGEPSALALLRKATSNLENAKTYLPDNSDLEAIVREMSDAYYRIEETLGQVRFLKDQLSFSPEELDYAIGRLDEIEKLKRKYNKDIEDILSYQASLERDLSSIENAHEQLGQLEKVLKEQEDHLLKLSQSLSQLRKTHGKQLTSQIESQLQELNFSNSTISLSFSHLKDSNGALLYTENGIDQVEFLISTNKGEPEKPLSKIASGGELSRIMLAFKKILADYDNIPTLIFDEIDSGISGIAASVVGKKLKEIGGEHQVICITHLPQIAACGTYHYRIEKHTHEEITNTSLSLLDHKERIQEVARLLGGINITNTTLESAKELLEASI